jgi:hypothetical protein
MHSMKSKRPRTETTETDENAVNQADAVNQAKSTKSSPARTAGTIKHLVGYTDTARAGGLAFGDDRELVKYPDNVYIIDDAIEAVKSVKSCAVCEDPMCTAKATFGANNPKAKPRRCRRHQKKTDGPVMCSHVGCVVKYPLVRRVSSEPDGPAICLWHALATKIPASYASARGSWTCTCGNHANFGIGKSRMVCGPCASIISRHLGTEMTHYNAGDCAKCGKRQGHDKAMRADTKAVVRVCRPCYSEIEAGGSESGFLPGKRMHACHKPGCTKCAVLKKIVNGKTTFSCPDHAKGDGAYERIKNPCRVTQCTRPAKYAANFGDTAAACSDHKEKNEFDVVSPRCRVCLATQLNWYDATIVKKRGGLCKGCDQEGGGPVIRFYEKMIVNAIVSKIHETGSKFEAVLDAPIKMHAATTAYRPDLVLRFANSKTVFVEVDEQQHASYECDRRREAAIFSSVADLERDKIMIRVNPDAGGAAFALFEKKPTVSELLESDGVNSFTTALFNQRLTDIVDLITRFVADEVQPGYVHHINWTTDVSPRPIHE